MLKILIVDDEPLVRKLIRYCIPWEEYGLTVAAEASGADEGMEMVREVNPDVVFTDITMPTTNGLEFTKMIGEYNPEIRVILVSGYDEFEYASTGIKLKVFDYILKPIDREILKKIAENVREDILKERLRETEFEKIKEELSVNAKYIIEKAFYALLIEEDWQNALECLRYYGIVLKNDMCQIAVIELSQVKEDETAALVRATHCKQTAKEYLEENQDIYLFGADTRKIILLNNNKDIEFEQFCDGLRERLEETLKTKLYIGVGNAYQDLSKLKLSFREATEALQYRYVIGESHTVCYEDICYFEQDSGEITEEILHKISFFVRSGMSEDVKKLMESLFDGMKRKRAAKDEVLMSAVKVVIEILPVFHMVVENGREMGQDVSSIITKIMALQTLADLESFLTNVLINVSRAVKEGVKEKDLDVVSAVVKYVEEAYKEKEMSLAGVAKKYFINSSYLSRVFKERTGKPFSDYLLEIRMENAKRLLSQTGLKAYEIAEEVGIKDPHYFSVCFKKYTGKSVSQYRQEQQE